MSGVAESGGSDAWVGILDLDERILWQGRPSARLRLEFRSPFEPLFFMFFFGFSLFWISIAAKAGGYFWTFGLLFAVVGFYGLFGVHFWKAYLRQRSHYTLTNRRALIAVDLPFKRELSSYPIRANSVLTLKDGTPGSIMFANLTTSDGEGGTTTTQLGFEMIDDARHVYSLMRRIQEGS